MDRSIEIVQLVPHDTPLLFEGIVDVYRAAFGQPPYNEGEADSRAFAENFKHHQYRPGFRCMLACEIPERRVIGFAYGCSSLAGQWWYDIVEAALPAVQARRWIKDAFELIELAVLPEVQGQGIGGRLHDRLLVGLPHATAVLSTMQAETRALHLYRRRGWAPLLENFHFPGVMDLYLVMGLDLRSE
ncbi:MAG TPA: GNAT family N-acetyltransferase [Anaerolineaceae bacterium]|nr:GNAT family N-acetyltransferase [Anaerolineaceae bacterium]